ncbi:MAG: DUF1993 domain-containing protein [Nevskia sp.]|nr:DUF1993 domain-containing protein [Nevskia sp.]
MITMYQASVPPLTRALTNLRAILKKGAAHAESRKFEPAVLLGSRLAPDMFALTRQVQIAADMAKGCAARLAGVEAPKYEDNEATFAELDARLEKTLAFLKSFKPEQIDGSEERAITLPTRNGTLEFKGQDYLLFFVLPNLHFHSTTAYDILRHNGVELGKMDYIGPP